MHLKTKQNLNLPQAGGSRKHETLWNVWDVASPETKGRKWQTVNLKSVLKSVVRGGQPSTQTIKTKAPNKFKLKPGNNRKRQLLNIDTELHRKHHKSLWLKQVGKTNTFNVEPNSNRRNGEPYTPKVRCVASRKPKL